MTVTQALRTDSLRTPDGKRYQYVLFSFDGCKHVDVWNELIATAASVPSKNPVHFTCFINAAYLIPDNKKNIYTTTQGSIGSSRIGFGGTESEVAERVRVINRAFALGHEIGGHTVGHFDGHNWSHVQWTHELHAFDDILNAARVGSLSPEKLHIPKEHIRGFRAPYLSTSPYLHEALADTGYTYDSSDIGTKTLLHQGGITEFTIPVIQYKNKPVVAMDYNMFRQDTEAKNKYKKESPEWVAIKKEVVAAYRNALFNAYNGGREPILISGHFDRWNDSVYIEAMKETMREVCRIPYVRCATFSDTRMYYESV